MNSTNYGPSTSELPATDTLQLGPARRQNTSHVRQKPCETHQNTGKAVVDPITLGFEQLNARFDNLNRQVESLERPQVTNKDLDDSEFDEADQKWEEYRRDDRRDRYLEDQPFNPKGRGRGRNIRGGRGDRFGGGDYHGRGGRLQRRNDQGVR